MPAAKVDPGGPDPVGLLIDLDDCLYRSETICHQVKERIQKYMVEHLGVAADEVVQMTSELYAAYGTTMSGLVAKGFKIDFDHWHQEVHAFLDYEELLHPDLLLREILCSIQRPKWILTNADRNHANKCLKRLGVADCFEGVFDFEWAMEAGKKNGVLTAERPVLCKPQQQVYELALKEINLKASEVVFLDDSLRNITAAGSMGIFTVLVGRDPDVGKDARVCIPTFHALPQALPSLFKQRAVKADAS